MHNKQLPLTRLPGVVKINIGSTSIDDKIFLSFFFFFFFLKKKGLTLHLNCKGTRKTFLTHGKRLMSVKLMDFAH